MHNNSHTEIRNSAGANAIVAHPIPARRLWHCQCNCQVLPWREQILSVTTI
jgi:hypothetical protein